jgi:hypothetical protein
MDHIKVGGIVLVKGRVQQNPAATKAQPANGSSRVLDVVAQEVTLLHKNRDVLSKSVRAAQRQGATDVKTAAQLLQLQQQQQQLQQQLGTSGIESLSELSFQNARNGSHGNGSTSRSKNAASYDTNKTAGSSSNGRTSRSKPAAAQPGQPTLGNPPAAAAAEAAEDGADHNKYWQLPTHIASRIHWVCDEQGIANMQQLVLPEPSNEHSSSSRSSSGVPDVVVGLDCEWRPYEKNSPATPVALLQLATRQHVFLVDLLAICQQQQQQQPDPCSENTSSSDGDNSRCEQANSSSSSSSSSSRRGVTPAEGALSRFLLSLLCDSRVVKVGFQLGTDLARLQVSTTQFAVVVLELPAVVVLVTKQCCLSSATMSAATCLYTTT